MSSGLSHAFFLTAVAHEKLASAGDDVTNFTRTPEEHANAHVAKKEAEAALFSSINLIDLHLGAVQEKAGLINREVTLQTTAPSNANVNDSEDPVEIAKRIHDGMGKGLAVGVDDLSKMAESIAPIITKFDETLKQPYLNEYSATVNTVPVVGLQNNKIVYVNVKSGSSVGIPSVVEKWEKFANLPTGVEIKDGDSVFFFPYKGDFFFAQGKAVWKKAHRAQGDPELAKAVNDWPHLYVQDWEKVGDNVLPSADLKGIAPFAVLSADRNVISFQLVVLHADGTLAYLANDQLRESASFEALSYVTETGGPESAPKWTKIAYWNNNVVAVDDQSRIWDIAPAFQAAQYKISNGDSIKAVTEFTATDAGVVGLRSDGYLYRRLVQAPRDDKGESILEWTRWIKVDGVTNLGVASPGVMLDLQTLTHSLRGRYVDVQTAIYPVVDKIRAFSITHATFLEALKSDADAWQKADEAGDDKAAAIAIAAAKKLVNHAKQWGKIVSKSVGGAQESVTVMTGQLTSVRNDLNIQLQKLKDDLTSLQKTLQVQQETLSKLNAAFWGSIAAMFLGIVVALLGAVLLGPAFIVAAVAGGLLFAAGLTAAIVFGIKAADMEKQISATEARIAAVTTAIKQLSMITANFDLLSTLYGNLNQFWGRMSNDASAIKTMDNVTAEAIGEAVLYDTSSIDAALDMTKKMANASTMYLDVLNRQGIRLPEN